MKRWRVIDSLGETIGYIESTATEEKVQQLANKLYAFDKPKIKLA